MNQVAAPPATPPRTASKSSPMYVTILRRASRSAARKRSAPSRMAGGSPMVATASAARLGFRRLAGVVARRDGQPRAAPVAERTGVEKGIGQARNAHREGIVAGRRPAAARDSD